MSDAATVDVSKGRYQLLENVASSSLTELFSLVDDSKQLAILLDFHDVVQNSLHFAIHCAVDTPHIEVDNLNDISMFGFKGHFQFVEKHLQYLFLITSLQFNFINFLIHDFNGDSLIRGEVYAHFNSGQ